MNQISGMQLYCVAVLVLTSLTPATCLSDTELLLTPENEELMQAMKEELDHFRVDMTKSFMQAHSRRKRAEAGLVTDVNVNLNGGFLETQIESIGPFSTFTFNGAPYLVQRKGIFRIDGFSALLSRTLINANNILTKVGSWNLQQDETVLHGTEWKHNFFLLTTNGSFSAIYTIHENNLQPVFRQRIRNKGNAVAAEFFEYRRNFYLVLGNNNEQHSTTFSPIFRWAGSYMDEIHEIQTTGVSAVKAFTINSKTYIALAQSRDSAGNMMLGTIVVSMDPMERLERVQLLWSHGANSLHVMTTAKEHFLLIGQEKEPSIMYWFGGMDFIFWQQFEGLLGKQIIFDGLQVTDDEPILIAYEGGQHLRFYSRSASATRILTTWVQSRSLEITSASSEEKLSQAKFMSMKNDLVFLALSRKTPGSHMESLRIYPINFVKRELAISRTKEAGDKLSQCLQGLSASLQDAEPILANIEANLPNVLRTDKDIQFDGTLVSDKIVKLDPTKSRVKSAQISPQMQQRSGSEDNFKKPPSQLLSEIQNSNDQLEGMKLQLPNVVYKSKPNLVTGNLMFPNQVQLNNVRASGSDLQVDTLNQLKWEDIKRSTLKVTSTAEPQQVTAPWIIESLVTDSISFSNADSKLNPSNFMRKVCPADQVDDSVTGTHQFNKGIKLSEDLQLGSTATINDIPFSDVVLKQNTHQEIRGFKHAAFVKGDFVAERVNDVNLKEWFSTVAKLNSPDVQHFTGAVKMTENAALQIGNLDVEELNGQNWENFASNVLINWANQTIKGFVTFDTLKVDHLTAQSIAGAKSDDLLTSAGTQHVTSQLFIDKLRINGPLTTSLVNGVHLSDAVNRQEPQVTINGLAILENFKLQDIFLPDSITIAGKDVSQLGKLQKVHIYSTPDKSPIIFKGQLQVSELVSETINNANVADFEKNYWTKRGNNVVATPQLVLSDKLVSILNDNFQAQTLNGFSFPAEFISLDQTRIVLNAPVEFRYPVTVPGNVTMDPGKTIEKIDMSEIRSMIVDENFRGVIRGSKTFTFPLVAANGAGFGLLNDMDLLNDVIMLAAEREQAINGILTFEGDVTTTQIDAQNGDIGVSGLVNGLDLGHVKATSAYKDQENIVDGEILFSNSIKADKMTLVNLNKVNVQNITDNMIFLHHPEIQEFQGGVTIRNGGSNFHSDSLVREINGVPVFDYLSKVVLVNALPSETIKGTKTFTNVGLKDELMCSTFNRVDLADLEKNAFSKSKSQTVAGKWALENGHFQENLATSHIGGIPMTDVVFTNQPVEISTPVTFTARRTKIQGPLTVVGDLNGLKFDENMKKLFGISGISQFDHVEIGGNLTWVTNVPAIQRLSYLFDNAVTSDGVQRIAGTVHFANGVVSSEIVSSDRWFHDVNLEDLKEDALIKDDSNWMISGNNKFSKPLHIERIARPVQELSVTDVNGENLEAMSGDVVRTTDDFSNDRVITGTKAINGGVAMNKLHILGKLTDIPIGNLVVKDDPREIEEVHFSDLDVNNVEFVTTSGLDLHSLLQDRVSLSTAQHLRGSYDFEGVDSAEACLVPMLNGIALNQTLKRSSLSVAEAFKGRKMFRSGLNIVGKLNTPSLNDHPITDLFESTLRVNREEIITRPVIFESAVVLNRPVEVNSMNEINMRSFSHDVSGRIGRLVSEAKRPELLTNSLGIQSEKLQRLSQESTGWLDYLRLKQDWTSLGPKSRVDHIRRSKAGDILVTLHHEEDGQIAGLPKGCSCNTVHTVRIDEVTPEKTMTVGVDNCLQIFHVMSPSGRAYTVTSETPSSNITCITGADKATKIFTEHDLIGKLESGHVSDVGVFAESDSNDYLILAEYFNKDMGSHSTSTRVIRVNPKGEIAHVQDIETHGARKVALNTINGQWMLAIANSKNSVDETSCIADSAIFMWSSVDEKFLLLRTVMTDGAFDVQFIRTETSSDFYEQSFVAFAQEGNSASGEIIIYKFEQLEGNFALSQTIRSKWPVTVLRSTSLCKQNFLITVVPQEGIIFYENRFVEGFQEYYKAPVFGATDISSFALKDKELFVITTNKGPILAEAVMTGLCSN